MFEVIGVKVEYRRNIVVSIRLPARMVQEIDEFVKEGLWPSRAEFIREAIRRLLLEVKAKLRGEEYEMV